MKIREIEIFKSPVKLKEPFSISLGTLYFASNVIVIIHTEEGITGYGECSPFATINGETIDTCFSTGILVSRNLVGAIFREPADILAVMDKTIYGNNSIKSAFDIAIWDICSREKGLPLFQFLGGRNDKKIFTDYTVSIGPAEKMAADAVKIKENGFPVIKVKLGKNGPADVERIKQIRKAIGSSVPLRIDANQGWQVDEAISTLRQFSDFNIQFCEEPVPRWMFMQLPQIRNSSPVRIMADESCFDHHDAERLLKIGACDLFNIKLGKSAGITNAVKISEIAERNGAEAQAGGFLESRLGFTATAHLAMAGKNIKYFDLDTPLMLEDDPVEGGIIYRPGGEVIIPEGSGLGLSIDKKFLAKLEKISVN